LGASLLLVPIHATRSPDCGGVLTPAGLSYFAEISKPHAETPQTCSVVRQNPAGESMALSCPGFATVPLVMKLSILSDLHVEMNPEGNLEMVASACKTSLEEMQSTEEMERSTPQFFLFWDLSNRGKEGTEAQICLEVTKLLLLPNERLMSLTAQFPVTPSCQVQYLPLAAPMFSEQGITISLQTIFQVVGMAIPLPVSPVPFSMPEPASSSPSHLTLAFSEHFYSSLFFALEMAGAFNMTIPVSRANEEQKIKITLLPRQMGSLFQEDLPVMLQAVFRSSPRVVLEEGKAALKLFLTVHVGAETPAFQSFLSVNVDMTAGLLLSVVDTRMMISAPSKGMCPCHSRERRGRDALLEELFLPTIREEIPAQMNVVLSEGVFLPHISSFTYTDVNVMIHKDYVLIPCNLKLQVRPGEQITMS
uniref:Lipid-binding serum glycoprotein C-terminal domain-containing protein n=1 Tax=Calidris pygmaea TaxID=425635 RepID=A0A8C3KPK6_9CHAR